jgi:hypothetical protein
MEQSFTKMTQLMMGEITNDILLKEVEIEEMVNNQNYGVRDKVNSIRRSLRELVLLELELQKLTSMITTK